MKVGDKVRVKVGKYTGKIGTIKTVHMCNNYDVEIPKVDRYCFFGEFELEVVPPGTFDLREAAKNALVAWIDRPNSARTEQAMRILERALSQ